MSAATPPDETQMKSSPSAFSALAIATASSGVSPPSRQSLPVMRAPSGRAFGTTARTARAIDSGKRMPVLKRAAILVGALVGDRRHEAVHADSRAPCAIRSHQSRCAARAAPRRRRPTRTRSMSASVDLARRVPALAERNRRGAMVGHGSASGLSAPAAFPGTLRPSPCGRNGRSGCRIWRCPCAAPAPTTRAKRRFVVVGIQAEAAMRDAAMALDVRRLHDHQRGAGIGQHAEMHEVPVIGAAIVGRILAHRRDHDAVGKLEARHAKRREQGTGHECVSALACARRTLSAAGWISDRR